MKSSETATTIFETTIDGYRETPKFMKERIAITLAIVRHLEACHDFPDPSEITVEELSGTELDIATQLKTEEIERARALKRFGHNIARDERNYAP